MFEKNSFFWLDLSKPRQALLTKILPKPVNTHQGLSHFFDFAGQRTYFSIWVLTSFGQIFCIFSLSHLICIINSWTFLIDLSTCTVRGKHSTEQSFSPVVKPYIRMTHLTSHYISRSIESLSSNIYFHKWEPPPLNNIS